MKKMKRVSLDAVLPEPAPASEQPPAELPSLPPPSAHVIRQSTYLHEAVHEQLRKLGFEENRKMHSYLMEGLDRVFADRGLPSLRGLNPEHDFVLTPGGYIKQD